MQSSQSGIDTRNAKRGTFISPLESNTPLGPYDSIYYRQDREDSSPYGLCNVQESYVPKIVRGSHAEHQSLLFLHFRSETPVHPQYCSSYKLRVEHNSNLVPSSLSEQQRELVLEKDVSVSKIAKNISAGKYNKIVVLTGAGISTSSGIADFVCIRPLSCIYLA